MLNNQRGLNPQHSSLWFPTKIRNNKNPFKTSSDFSHFLQFPFSPTRLSVPVAPEYILFVKMLFLSAVVSGGRRHSRIAARAVGRAGEGEAEGRDLAAAPSLQDVCSLCTGPGADLASVSFAAPLRCALCSLAVLLIPFPSEGVSWGLTPLLQQ